MSAISRASAEACQAGADKDRTHPNGFCRQMALAETRERSCRLYRQATFVPRPSLASNKTATAGGEQAGYPASGGNDEDVTTRFCAKDGNAGHWWTVDLGSMHELTAEVHGETQGPYQYSNTFSCRPLATETISTGKSVKTPMKMILAVPDSLGVFVSIKVQLWDQNSGLRRL